MFSEDSYNYYFLAVDCFSRYARYCEISAQIRLAIFCIENRRIFTTNLHQKTTKEVKAAIENVMREGNMTISTLQTDQGSEFKHLKKWLDSKGVRWTPKVSSLLFIEFKNCT
jgi:hypothetical protein